MECYDNRGFKYFCLIYNDVTQYQEILTSLDEFSYIGLAPGLISSLIKSLKREIFLENFLNPLFTQKMKSVSKVNRKENEKSD